MANSTKGVGEPPIVGSSFKTRKPPPEIVCLIRHWITDEDADLIHSRFLEFCILNRQVLWSGMTREFAQRWADSHDFQTLTTALGPLPQPKNSEDTGAAKSPGAMRRFLHGASIIFAWFITYGDLVTVLSQPPPQRFHPSGQTFYQLYEEPIIKGQIGGRAVNRIVTAHPTIGGAAVDFTYEIWPHDEPSLWTAAFGLRHEKVYWRQVKGSMSKPITGSLKGKNTQLKLTEADVASPASKPSNCAKAKRKKEEEKRKREEAMKKKQEEEKGIKKNKKREMKKEKVKKQKQPPKKPAENKNTAPETRKKVVSTAKEARAARTQNQLSARVGSMASVTHNPEQARKSGTKQATKAKKRMNKNSKCGIKLQTILTILSSKEANGRRVVA